MDEKEIAALVMIVRRAPLHNMDEAETVSKLLERTIAALRAAQPKPPLALVEKQ